MSRVELLILSFFSAVWLVAALAFVGLLPLEGLLVLGLYQLYGLAAFLGWLSGNIYVERRRRLPLGRHRKRLLVTYLLGPPSVVYVLRAMAPAQIQAAAPVVPLYAFLVFGLFFLVPVSFRRDWQRPSQRRS